MSKIKTIRDRLGMTQKALADALGCAQGNVSFYEKGQTVPPTMAQKLIDLAKVQGLELSFDHIYSDLPLPEPVAKVA
ncbi:helix-turn-helix transcriptional regulator [Variovorax sp. J22R193]|uniref:helix-turn-helix domain-containing protein n=1 Tax=Variovorax fucosicus TaxID=3053517 RepID=UPI002574EEB3|nr:helix-turn-helix transcriptional regulator [Variovorax sp. J22R193]MDM0041847.1 helix-turn-helix transcriptional regulator [Variovorax sp. J22R193]